MAAIRFSLECALVAVAVGLLVSIGVAGIHRAFRRWSAQWAPSRRADVLLVLAVLPGTAAVAVTLAAAVPSMLAAAGLHHDHCTTHLHHPHLCLMHAFDLPISRTLLGAGALAILSFKGAHLLLSVVARRRAVRALEALGVQTMRGRFGVIRVPGGPKLCHAVGIAKRRVLLSEGVARAVSREQLAAALAHEEAHHERMDGLASFIVRLSALFHAPVVMKGITVDHREATEEAADVRAAAVVGDPRLVAEAIVSIARIQVGEPSFANGITGAGIERRVMRLLDAAEDRSSPGLIGVVGGLGLSGASILFAAESVHHAVETLLHLL